MAVAEAALGLFIVDISRRNQSQLSMLIFLALSVDGHEVLLTRVQILAGIEGITLKRLFSLLSKSPQRDVLVS